MSDFDLREINAQVKAALEPVERNAAEIDKKIAEVQAAGAADPQPDHAPIAAMLERAARAPGAPATLTGLAERVERGELTWEQIIVGDIDDPEVRAFRAEANQVAQRHFAPHTDEVDHGLAAAEGEDLTREGSDRDDDDNELREVPRTW